MDFSWFGKGVNLPAATLLGKRIGQMRFLHNRMLPRRASIMQASCALPETNNLLHPPARHMWNFWQRTPSTR
jgi:hypothetical protein